MKNAIIVVMIMVILAVAGCAQVVGPYYLKQGKYEDGIETLSEKFRENPTDASSAYYLGRYYLALDKPEKGKAYFEKAVSLAPESAQYVFWLGVANWALLDFDAEQAAYRKALELDPNYISAHLYLGHGYLDRGQWQEALKEYDAVLELDEYNPEALYNRAVVLAELGQGKEEIAAWKKFLEYYPDGSLAMEATEKLNLHGDFTYRNFILGQRNVTLHSLAFKPGTNELEADSKPSLHVLTAMMKENKALDVHIVAYVDGDSNAAKDRAINVRDYMLNGNPSLDPARLPLSWFGTAEAVFIGDETFTIDESVKLITVVR